MAVCLFCFLLCIQGLKTAWWPWEQHSTSIIKPQHVWIAVSLVVFGGEELESWTITAKKQQPGLWTSWTKCISALSKEKLNNKAIVKYYFKNSSSHPPLKKPSNFKLHAKIAIRKRQQFYIKDIIANLWQLILISLQYLLHGRGQKNIRRSHTLAVDLKNHKWVYGIICRNSLSLEAECFEVWIRNLNRTFNLILTYT